MCFRMCFLEKCENISQYLSILRNRGGEWWKFLLDQCGIDTSTREERFERKVKSRMHEWEVKIYSTNHLTYIPMTRRQRQEEIIRHQLEDEGY